MSDIKLVTIKIVFKTLKSKATDLLIAGVANSS